MAGPSRCRHVIVTQSLNNILTVKQANCFHEKSFILEDQILDSPSQYKVSQLLI